MPLTYSKGRIVKNRDGSMGRTLPPFAQLSDNEWLFENDLTDSKGSDDLTNSGLTFGYVTEGGLAVTTYGTESVYLVGPANGLMAGNADKQLVISTRIRITGDTPNAHDRGIVSEGRAVSRALNPGRYVLSYQPAGDYTYYWNISLRESDGTTSFEQVAINNMGFLKWFDLVFVINPGVSARLWQDGELVYTKELTQSAMGENYPFWVGGLYDINYTPWNHQGDMQWVRAWKAKNYNEAQLASLIAEEHATAAHDVYSPPATSVKDHEYLFNDDLTDDGDDPFDLTNNGLTFSYIDGGGVNITGPQLKTVGFDAAASIVYPNCDQQVIVSARMYSTGMTIGRVYGIFSSDYWAGGNPAWGQFDISMVNYASPQLWCYMKFWSGAEVLTQPVMPSYSHNAWWDMLVSVTPGDSVRMYYEGNLIGTPLDISGYPFSLQVYNYPLKVFGLHCTDCNPRNWMGQCKWVKAWVRRDLTASQIDALATSEHAL